MRQSFAMGLGRQLFQRLLSVFQSLALGPEGGIPQAGSPIGCSRTITPTRMTVSTLSATALGPLTASTSRIATVSRAATTTGRRSRGVFFHARAIITTHSDHGTGDSRLERRGCSSGIRLGGRNFRS